MKYMIDFVAKETHVGGVEIELEDGLTDGQKEDAAINVVEFTYPELTDVEVTKIMAVA